MLNDAGHIALWSGLKAGDKDAFLALYKEFYLELFNFGLRLTGDRELTRDCITQSLLRLWDKRHALPVVRNLPGYLLTCLRHEIYAVIRSERQRLQHTDAMRRFYAAEESSYETQLIAIQETDELKARLGQALAGLTKREKELLRMRFFEDMDYEQIAAHCHITKRTAYNIIHGALKHLREMLPQKIFLPFS